MPRARKSSAPPREAQTYRHSEATIPTAVGLDTESETPGIKGEPHENYVQRMLDVLRRAPVLHLPGNQTVTLKNIRPPAKALTLSAEALVSGSSRGNEAQTSKSEVRNPKSAIEQWQAELPGLDTFDPVTMETDHLNAADVPAWFLDTDYSGMVFRVRQAFFPRTGAWQNLKKALRVEFEDTVWDHLADTTSAPFPAGKHGQIAVKVIEPRGSELLVVEKLEERK